jgi:hypothetical protein
MFGCSAFDSQSGSLHTEEAGLPLIRRFPQFLGRFLEVTGIL